VVLGGGTQACGLGSYEKAVVKVDVATAPKNVLLLDGFRAVLLLFALGRWIRPVITVQGGVQQAVLQAGNRTFLLGLAGPMVHRPGRSHRTERVGTAGVFGYRSRLVVVGTFLAAVAVSEEGGGLRR
jgi:hypothetical protein